MRSYSRISIGIFCFAFFSMNFRCTLAVDAQGEKEDTAHAELIELGNEFMRLVKERPTDEDEESDSALPDEEWLAKSREVESREPNPARLLPSFISFAKRHSESPFSLDALQFVIRQSSSDVADAAWELKEEALELALKQHVDDPRLVHVLDIASELLPSEKTELLFRGAIEKSQSKTVRVAAVLHLARHRIRLGEFHRMSKMFKKKKKPRNPERFWKLVVTPYLEKEFPYDQEKVTEEVERLLTNLMDNYADIPATDWKTSGPARVFLETETFPKPKTYGDLAKSALYAMNSVVPGKRATNIEGKDANGNRFQLNDYRGKVVLLTFSANWCGGCVELYPLQRALVHRFRDEPFVLLSVSRDETVETLRASLKSGDITWRCWWDGIDGPIKNAWNCRGVPAVVLLDKEHVVQDVQLNRFTPKKDFEAAITELLKKAKRQSVGS